MYISLINTWTSIEELTHWGWDKMADIFQTTFSNGILLMKYEFRLKFHSSLFYGGPINNIIALLIILLSHMCVTRPQWVRCFNKAARLISKAEIGRKVPGLSSPWNMCIENVEPRCSGGVNVQYIRFHQFWSYQETYWVHYATDYYLNYTVISLHVVCLVFLVSIYDNLYTVMLDFV